MSAIEAAIAEHERADVVRDKRLRALREAAEAGLQHEPPGADVAVIWIEDRRPGWRHAVRAMRVKEGAWVWLDLANHAVTGPWADLVRLVTDDDRHPVAFSVGSLGTAATFLPRVAADPRDLG